MDRYPAEHVTPQVTALETTLRIAVIGLLIYACGRIILPFGEVLLWATILAVMLHPLHLRVATWFGNRGSAMTIGFVGTAVILGPLAIGVTALGSSVTTFIFGLQHQGLIMPPPPSWLADIPLVGQKLMEAWLLSTTNIPAALTKYGEPFGKLAPSLLSFVRTLVSGGLSFLLSFAIAAVLIAYAEGAVAIARRVLERLTGDNARGGRMVPLAAATIRGVALGVVGVAVIQAALVGIGFFAIGLPAAGMLTLVVLFLAVVQIPATILTLPVIGYVFMTEATAPAIIFLVWTLLAGLSDSILKPFMLGRGLEVPMPIILIGVIGGVLTDGLLGLFLGPVLLALGYLLFIEWLRWHPAECGPQTDSPPA